MGAWVLTALWLAGCATPPPQVVVPAAPGEVRAEPGPWALVVERARGGFLEPMRPMRRPDAVRVGFETGLGGSVVTGVGIFAGGLSGAGSAGPQGAPIVLAIAGGALVVVEIHPEPRPPGTVWTEVPEAKT